MPAPGFTAGSLGPTLPSVGIPPGDALPTHSSGAFSQIRNQGTWLGCHSLPTEPPTSHFTSKPHWRFWQMRALDEESLQITIAAAIIIAAAVHCMVTVSQARRQALHVQELTRSSQQPCEAGPSDISTLQMRTRRLSKAQPLA